MNYRCYILYSETLKKFYIGSTSEKVETRLEQHNSGFYGDRKYTHRATDWEIYLFIECKTRKQAELIEKHIKSMKSTRYKLNLKKYPEMQKQLLERFANS